MNNIININKPKERYLFIDFFRAFLIFLMTLDHISSFMGMEIYGKEYWGTQFMYPSTPQFIFRVITHVAAVGFIFLLGISISLRHQKYYLSDDLDEKLIIKKELTNYLLVRGLILILLQLTIVNIAWLFAPSEQGVPTSTASKNDEIWIYLGILWLTGMCCIIGAIAQWIPSKKYEYPFIIVIISSIICPFFFIPKDPFPSNDFPFVMLMFFYSGQSKWLYVTYPVIPWLSVLFLGMMFGRYIHKDHKTVMKDILYLGLIFLFLFFPFRYIGDNININYNKWDPDNLITFFYLTKYPPSVPFFLFWTGITFICFYIFYTIENLIHNKLKLHSLLKKISTTGSTPLFYYVIHFWLIVLLTQIFSFPSYVLVIIYAILIMIILTPICQKYRTIKKKNYKYLKFL